VEHDPRVRACEEIDFSALSAHGALPAEIVAEIASASQEQSTGIDQINKALNQMDEVTQQNSALVEENAASAKTLEHQSGVMNQKVAFFRRTKQAEGHAAKAAATVAAAAVAAMPRPPAAAPRNAPQNPLKHPPQNSPKSPPKQEAAPIRKAALAINGTRGGPVGRMQAAVASAIAEDPDWKEF